MSSIIRLLVSRWLPLAFLSVFSLSLAAAPEPEQWQLLGHSHLLSTNEVATLKVISKAQDTAFHTIKFHVSHGDVRLIKAKVHMSDGKVVKVSIQKTIRAGLETRPLPIPDHQRGIKKVELFYQSPTKHPADISLLGQASMG